MKWDSERCFLFLQGFVFLLRLSTFDCERFFLFSSEESYKFAAPCDTVAALDKLFSQMGLSETSALAAKASWFEVGGCEIKPWMNAPDYVIIFKRQSRQRLWKINQRRRIQITLWSDGKLDFLSLWSMCIYQTWKSGKILISKLIFWINFSTLSV